MFFSKTEKAAPARNATTASPGRRRTIGAAVAVAAVALTAVAVPASAQSQGKHTGSSSHSHAHYLSPLQVTSAYYASYNGDLAAGFDRYISKDLVLHGFNGPESRADWINGDLNIKAGLTGFKMTVLDQIVEGDKVVTRWSFAGRHTGTIFGIPASGQDVQLSGISIDRVIDGQSVEHWSEGNFGVFLDTLRGQTPPGSAHPSSK